MAQQPEERLRLMEKLKVSKSDRDLPQQPMRLRILDGNMSDDFQPDLFRGSQITAPGGFERKLQIEDQAPLLLRLGQRP